jgi:hypothetical protein
MQRGGLISGSDRGVQLFETCLLFLVIDQRLGISASLERANITTEQILGIHMPELWQPIADVITISIEL